MTGWPSLVLWCSAQVTVISALAIVADRVVLRRWAHSPVPFAALLAIPMITVLSLGPLSQWSWLPESAAVLELSPGRAVDPPSSTPVIFDPPPSHSSEKTSARPMSPGGDDRPSPRRGERPSPATISRAAAESTADESTDRARRIVSRDSPDAPRDSDRATAASVGKRASPSPAVAAVREIDWPATLAGAMLVAVAVGSVRLALGVLGLIHLVRRSRLLDDPWLDNLLREVAGRLGVSPTVSLREAGALSTAATVSWPQTILLPTTWRSWSRQELLAVLAHELAHIRQRDFTSWLLAQAGVVLHYYHPLVHYLASRLRLHQEFLADSLAAKAIGDERAYIGSLAHLALSQPSYPSLLIARSFLPRRRLIVRRIQMLQQRTPQFPLSRFPQRILCAAVVLAAVGMAGLRLPTASTQEPGSAGGPTDAPNAGVSGFQQSGSKPAIRVDTEAIEGVWNVGRLIAATPTIKPPGALVPPTPVRLVFRGGHYYLLDRSRVLDQGDYRIEESSNGAYQLIVSRPGKDGGAKNWWLPTDTNTALVLFDDSQSQVTVHWSMELTRDPDPAALARCHEVIEKHPVSPVQLKMQPLLFDWLILQHNQNVRSWKEAPSGDRELAGRLLRRTCAQCHDGNWQDRRLSLDWVPTDAVFVAAIRVSKLGRHRFGSDFARHFGLDWPSGDQPTTPLEIRQVTVISFSWDLFKQRALSLPTASALVLHLKKPVSPEAAQQAFAPLLGRTRTRTVGRYRYWKSKEDGSSRCVWRSEDGRTVIVGLDEPGFLRVLAAGQRGVSAPPWFGGTDPPISSYLSPVSFPWGAGINPNPNGLADFHNWFGFYEHDYRLPGGVPIDARLVADLLMYVPLFRLRSDADMQRALAFLPSEQRRDANRLASLGTELILGAKLGPQRTYMALYYTTKSSQVADDSWSARDVGSRLQAGREGGLASLVDSLFLSTRLALSNSRDRVSRQNAADVLDRLDRLNAAEEVLDSIRAFATNEAVTLHAVVPTDTLERLLKSFRLASADTADDTE